MLFVFGKRALQMRQKKISDLIHRSKGTRCSFARVSIYFCDVTEDDGAFEKVEGSDFVVSRECTMEGSSRYCLDGRTAQMKEITELLKSKGVDLDHNRFLILQGEVEQVSLLPAKGEKNKEGLLEFLEDIIGSNRLIPDIMESEKALTEGLEDVRENKDRLKVLKNELDNLEGPVKDARRYCEMERQCKVTDAKIERKALALEDSRMKENREQLDALLVEWAAWTRTLDADRQKKVELEKEVVGNVSKIRKLQKHQTKLTAEMQTMSNEDHALDTAKTNLNKKLGTLQREVKKLSTASAAIDGQVAEHDSKAAQFASRLPKAESELAKARDRIELLDQQVQGELDARVAEKDSIERRMEPQRTALSDLKAQKKILDSKLQRLRLKQDAAGQTPASVYKQLKEATTHLEAVQVRLKDRAVEKAAEEAKLTKSESQLRHREAAMARAEDECQGFRKMAEAAEGRYNEQSKSRSLTSVVMQAVSDGNLRALGSLWDMASYDPEYQVAFEAAGATKDYIVTETEEDSRDVVNFARARNLGRVSCLVLPVTVRALEKLMGKIRRRTDYPRDSTFLMDLVEVKDDKILPAVCFALKDTLLAQNVVDARRLAFESGSPLRVVSKCGVLIERTGIMSGGGAKRSRAPTGPPVTLQQLEVMRKEAEISAAHLRNLRTERKTLEMTVKTAAGRIASLKVSIEDLQAEVETRKESIDTITKLEGQTAPELTTEERRQLNSFGQKAEKLDAQLGVLEEAVSKSKAQVDEINEKIDLVGGSERATLRKKIDALTTEVTDMKDVLDDGPMTVELLHNKKEELDTKKIPEKKAQIAKDQTRLKEVDQKKEELLGKARALLDRKSDVESMLATYDAEVQACREKLKEVEELHKEAGLKEVEFQNQRSDLENALERKKAGVRKHLKALERLKAEYDGIPDLQSAQLDADSPRESQETETAAVKDKKDDTFDSVLDLSSEELEQMDGLVLESHSEKLRINLENVVRPDVRVVERFTEIKMKFNKRHSIFDKAREQCNQLKRALEALKATREAEFRSGFSRIALRLKEMYRMLTVGGDAELEIADPDDPFESGILFSVRPPHKSWRPIRHLSGGEKTLSSLALIFALHHVKPSALYFLDEIDAALDFRN
ncbi:MAG: hypothetical protein KVP17_002329, partial [Porospora cf. gigantea B]|uniref:uncharacterized protein n=1 Tax=Porospora cf. gigantea B TaxID=2853592 RepID=UPI003571A903